MIQKDKQKYDISISSATPSDSPYIFEIEKCCFSEPWSESCIISGISNQSSYFIISKFGSAVIGYAGMYSIIDEAYIYNIAVKPDYRGLGVGKRLLFNLEGYCRENKIKFLSLEVRESNSPAIAMYSNQGFTKIGYRRSFYKKPVEDALIMTKYFSKKDVRSKK